MRIIAPLPFIRMIISGMVDLLIESVFNLEDRNDHATRMAPWIRRFGGGHSHTIRERRRQRSFARRTHRAAGSAPTRSLPI
jgi:hypothetical protein